jgi:hypothetical protein
MSPTKQYMLQRALRMLEGVASSDKMPESEIKFFVRDAVKEIKGVVRQLDREDKQRVKHGKK